MRTASAIDCVLFDMDGVLCDYDRDVRLEHLGKAMGTDRETARKVMYTSNIEWRADAGELAIDAYMAALSDGFGRTLTEAQWLEARQAATQVRPSMVQLGARLASRTKIAILSNNSFMMARHLRDVAGGLFPLFDGKAFVSAAFGAKKPEAACYTRCLAHLSLDARRTLFVDDSQENVDGARAAGVEAHLFVDEPSLVAWLASFHVTA